MNNVKAPRRSKAPFLKHHHRSVSIEDAGIQPEGLWADCFKPRGGL
jgi:hypothetical protein